MRAPVRSQVSETPGAAGGATTHAEARRGNAREEIARMFIPGLQNKYRHRCNCRNRKDGAPDREPPHGRAPRPGRPIILHEREDHATPRRVLEVPEESGAKIDEGRREQDRKSTRLNSSH